MMGVTRRYKGLTAQLLFFTTPVSSHPCTSDFYSFYPNTRWVETSSFPASSLTYTSQMFFTAVATVALASAAAATSIPTKRDLIQPIPVRSVNHVPGPSD